MDARVVGVIGASGFIGERLCVKLEESGWRVVRISRSVRHREGEEWRVLGVGCLEGLDALVNLAGDRIDKRWTAANKVGFRKSRVGLTEELRGWIGRLPRGDRLKVWVNASAVGIYGDRGDEVLTEESSMGDGYLADLCRDWEGAAHGSDMDYVRIVHPRIGIVLGEGGAAWGKMKLLFKFGLGGKLGSGEQWFPWVYVEDLVSGLVFCLEDSRLEGAVNLCSPEVVQNSLFTKSLAAALGRPSFFRVPRFVLRVVAGEFSGVLLASQRIFPSKLHKYGFKFEYRRLEVVLKSLCQR